MERFTRRYDGGVICDDVDGISKGFAKLADLEDAEEQGRLVIFPCAVGDHLWEVYDYYPYYNKPPIVRELEVYGLDILTISIVDHRIETMIYARSEEDGTVYLGTDLIGETLFFTREEAETKLKELMGEG